MSLAFDPGCKNNDCDVQTTPSRRKKYKMYVGDVKQSFQTFDHSGWVLLDGRPISDLFTNQKNRAVILGIGEFLPNANGVVLMQNGSVGSVVGSNERTLLRSDLPNQTLSGTTQDSGWHNHDINYRRQSDIQGGGNASRDLLTGTATATKSTVGDGVHSHNFTTESMNGGVPQTSFDITPKSLGINNFIFLGL